jgi:hypothetical protein
MMKIQLTLRGGIYGIVKLAQIDTEADGSDFPDHLLEVIRSKPLRAFKIDASAKADSQRGDQPFETEQELYDLLVSVPDNDQRFMIPRSALEESDASIKELIDGIYSRAKPIPE